MNNVVKLPRKVAATRTVTVKAHKRVIRTKRINKPVVIEKPVLTVGHKVLLARSLVSSIITQISAETEKAWLFTAYDLNNKRGYDCWLPKSAIEIAASDKQTAICKLADWFNPKGFTYRWLNYNAVANELLKRSA